MPRHKHVTTCLRGGGPISKFCTCYHCTLAVCSVCGAYEGGLTTDCPGARVDFDRQKEVYETPLDYTDDRGWHLGETMATRSPRFEDTRIPPERPRADPRAEIAPTIDWTAVDRNASLQHELAKRAIAWVVADRTCEDQSAALTRLEDEIDARQADAREGVPPSAELLALHARLERDKIDWKISCRRTEQRDEEFRQAARRLVAALEDVPKKGEP